MDWKKRLKGLKLFPTPKKSSSSESKSLYLGIKETRYKTFILQYLTANSKTSYHYHNKIKEKHIILAGECYIRKEGKLKKIKNEEITNPKEPHGLETKKESCLILLEIFHKNIKDWKKDKIIL